MIEDTELTRKILEYFASDDISFPADVIVESHLTKEFPEISLEVLQYHVICAIDCGLLHGTYKRTPTLSDGVLITIGYIDGLTSSGGDYVKQSRTSHLKTAMKSIQDAGIQVTTALLVETLNYTIKKAIGLS